MDAITLAKAAEASAKPYIDVLAPEIIEKIKLSYVAQWLANQDQGTDSARVLYRAQEAVRSIQLGEFAA